MLGSERLSERMRGRWRAALPALGIPDEFLTGKHGPCPFCDGGRDRWRFDDKERGMWLCGKCGWGDGFELLQRYRGWTFRQAAQEVERLVDNVPRTEPRKPMDPEQAALAMHRLWLGSKPVEPGDPVSRWLKARVGLTHVPGCLRTYTPPNRHPAMLAAVSDVDGRLATLHRTWLTPTGDKAPVEQPRMMFHGVKMPKGGAVRLHPVSGGVLGIAEGIETALAAAALFSVPCWAALSSSGLASWQPPDDAREVIVFGDNDVKFGGQAAAYALAHRLAAGGLKVRVEIPPAAGCDWNDVYDQDAV